MSNEFDSIHHHKFWCIHDHSPWYALDMYVFSWVLFCSFLSHLFIIHQSNIKQHIAMRTIMTTTNNIWTLVIWWHSKAHIYLNFDNRTRLYIHIGKDDFYLGCHKIHDVHFVLLFLLSLFFLLSFQLFKYVVFTRYHAQFLLQLIFVSLRRVCNVLNHCLQPIAITPERSHSVKIECEKLLFSFKNESKWNRREKRRRGNSSRGRETKTIQMQ